jgi:hypothetical protein
MYKVHALSTVRYFSNTSRQYIHAQAQDKIQSSEHLSSLLTFPPRTDASETKAIETDPVLCKRSHAGGRRPTSIDLE